MCGITGKINFHRPPSLVAIERMTKKLIHRGPDFGKVISIDECAVFGHRRLAIIDLSELANQPMQDLSKRYTIVYNGEVYNFLALRKQLQTLGFCFRSQSDTEVVLNAYSYWGDVCFEKFNGMFACAIWDSLEKVCVLARDKMGEKPLYYTLLNHELSFASECSALLADDRIKDNCTKSIEALNHYFALGYIVAPCTQYNEIFKLEPASYLKYSSGNRITKNMYWDYKKYFFINHKENEQEIAEHLDTLVSEAVRQRLVCDVAVGSFLSGGLDSSLVVAKVQKYYRPSLQTFSVAFKEKSYNEAKKAQLVANLFQTMHQEITIDLHNDSQGILKAIRCFDEPFSDTSLIPMYFLAKVAASKVKVVLSGDGADELFAGYSTHHADALKVRLDKWPNFIKKCMASALSAYPVYSNRKMNLGFKMKQFSKGLAEDFRLAHYRWRELFSMEQRIAIIGERHAQQLHDTDPFKSFKRLYDDVKGLDKLSQHLYVDAKTWLADDILVKIDRTAMAHSLETRCPYLDGNIVEYAAGIPSNLKIKKTTGKYILRKAAVSILPRSVYAVKKSGFNAPVGQWLDGECQNEFTMFNRYVANERNVLDNI